jgi:DNA-binding XRE family transcriptional regulator
MDCYSSAVDSSASLQHATRMGALEDEPLTSRFGFAIRQRREKLGISQEEFAARCGLHRTYVAGVERGIRNPSLKSIARIAEGLGMSISALFLHMERVRRGQTHGRNKR